MPEGIYNPALDPTVGKGDSVTIFNTFLRNFIGIAMIVGAIVFLAFFIMGAIQYIVAAGDKAKLEAAKGKIQTALIGILLLFVVFAIMKFVGKFFGIIALENLLFDLSPFFVK